MGGKVGNNDDDGGSMETREEGDKDDEVKIMRSVPRLLVSTVYDSLSMHGVSEARC